MSSVELRRQCISLVLSVVLVFTVMGSEAGAWAYQGQEPPANAGSASSDYSGQGTPRRPQELQSLVAPIALYPDALVAQILNAATFPDQVAVANYWMQQNKNLTGSAWRTAVNGQIVGPERQGADRVPVGAEQHGPEHGVDVAIGRGLSQPAGGRDDGDTNLARTGQGGRQSEVGLADHRGAAVAADHRHSADESAGGLCSAVQPDGDLRHTVRRSRYSTADVVATGLLSFGAGMAVGAMMSGGCCGWGYSSWNCNWYHGGSAYYHGAPYYGNSWLVARRLQQLRLSPLQQWLQQQRLPRQQLQRRLQQQRIPPQQLHTADTTALAENNYNHNTNVSGNTVNVNSQNAPAAPVRGPARPAPADGASSDAARGWGSHSDSGGSTGFQRFWQPLRLQCFGGGGWGSRASSSRGWGSRGGGGGWGGEGGFRGGGRISSLGQPAIEVRIA